MNVEITTATLLRGAAIAGAIWLLAHVWTVLLLVVVALMLAGALGPPVAWLERHGWRRAWAITVAFGAVALALAGFLFLTVPSFIAQLSDIVDRFPRLQAQTVMLLRRWRPMAPLADSVGGAQLTQLIGNAAGVAISYSGRAVEFIAYCVTCVFLALYLLVDRDRMRGALFALVPRDYHVRLSRVVVNLETIVGGYVRGQIVTSIMMAIFTFAVLKVAGVPNAVALSVFAGLTDVLPYIGGLLACGPAVISTYGAHGLGPAIGVLCALSLYQEVESRVIVPRVYGRVLRLSSAVVVVALLVGGSLLGILGALLALPIAAAIPMFLEELRVELPGEPAVDEATREIDAREERVFRKLAGNAPAEEAAAIATAIAAARLERHGEHGE